VSDPLAVSFTASRDLDARGQEVIAGVLTVRLPRVACYITGGAAGGDAFIGRWLATNLPGAHHVVVVPADKSQVDPWWLTAGVDVEVIPMPAGTTFKDRNAELVRRGTAVFGFPACPEDDPRSLRSGTWQTVRMARKAGNLSQWHCLRLPYAGRIEVCPEDLFAATLTAPGAAHLTREQPGTPAR
jgi:hypothetical protein